MSGFLFILVLDWVMNNSVEGKNTGIRWKFMSKLEDLDFAYDIALLSSKYSDIQSKTTSLKEWTEKVGLKININKTKTMRISVKEEKPVRLDAKDLEDVQDFTHLGSKVNRRNKRRHKLQTAKGKGPYLLNFVGVNINVELSSDLKLVKLCLNKEN
jgi:hypothetical protein